MNTEKIWRWNVNDVWFTYSSMCREIFFAKNASNTVDRYHHLTASFLFGGCSLECFLNENFRAYSKNISTPEDVMMKAQEGPSLRKKLTTWPEQICGVKLDEKNVETVLGFWNFRHDLVHRKRDDHSLYKELDDISPDVFLASLQNVFTEFYAGLNRPFPYWLLGWNFVGLNNDPAHPCLSSNQQFRYSLRNMGFNVPAADIAQAEVWENNNMKGVEAFRKMQSDYYAKSPEIEKKTGIFRNAPRLCKRWWDREFIMASIKD
jgi:hypothetical protein